MTRPRLRPRLTDTDILSLINEERIIICPFTPLVTSRLRRRPRVLTPTIVQRPRSPAYRFIHICHNNGRKKIALHRLVWISFYRQLPPSTHHVDHIHGPDAGDHIDNLQLLPAHINCATKCPDLKRSYDPLSDFDHQPF